MKELFTPLRSVCLSLLLVITTLNAYPQAQDQTQDQNQTQTVRTAPPPIDLKTAPIRDQLNQIQQRTRIYDNFRAVREDMFQTIKKNVTDTISTLQKRIASQNSQTDALRTTIDSLNGKLSTTQGNLDDVTRSKNSIIFLGMEVEKGTYNTIMWSIIIALLLLLVIGSLVFKRNQNVVNNRTKDLEDLKAEFEAYRKTSREAREKMALQHFNELKKLRGE